MHLLILLEGSNTLADAAKTAIGDKRQAYILACIGLAGSLIPVVLSWTKDIGVNSQRVKQLDEGVKRIAFWEQWLKLSVSLGEEAADLARKRVRSELDLLCTALSTSAAELHSEASALKVLKTEFKSKLESLSWVQRALLLYKPARPLAWVPRFFYYLFVAFTAFGILFEPVVLFDKDQTGKASLMSTFLIFAIFMAVVAVCFRYLSISLEKPHKQTAEAAPDLPSIPVIPAP